MRIDHKSLAGIAALGVTALAAIGPVGAGSAAALAHSGSRELGTAVLGPRSGALWTSSNWSGYAIGSKTTPKHTYKSISATWRVPTVKTTSGNKYSSQWIGIDGFTNQNLIQTGTEADFTNGHASYGVWWEILPAASTPINEPVKPGMTITASITESSSGKWTIKISNGSWTFTKNTGYSGPGQSVEWIVEAPQVGGSITSICHTGRVTFHKLTVNGAAAKLTAAEGGQLKQNGVVRETPSAPSTVGDAFTMGYGVKAPPAPKG
jgi:hypothetical protein